MHQAHPYQPCLVCSGRSPTHLQSRRHRRHTNLDQLQAPLPVPQQRHREHLLHHLVRLGHHQPGDFLLILEQLPPHHLDRRCPNRPGKLIQVRTATPLLDRLLHHPRHHLGHFLLHHLGLQLLYRQGQQELLYLEHHRPEDFL